jgi:hypothetical protein
LEFRATQLKILVYQTSKPRLKKLFSFIVLIAFILLEIMFGADDVLDDMHWKNVQDPIKQMFLTLTKAIKVQAAGMRDLDRKCNELIPYDAAERLIKERFDSCCTKQDATQLIYQIDTKAGDKELSVLESRITEVSVSLHQ